jgi:hypothetical protein
MDFHIFSYFMENPNHYILWIIYFLIFSFDIFVENIIVHVDFIFPTFAYGFSGNFPMGGR